MRVWRAAPQFDPARGRFTTWLAAITRHHLSRQLGRRGGEHRTLAAVSVEAALEGQGETSDDTVRNEDARVILQALRRLPAEQRRVIVLAYFAGMTQSQMAEHLGIPLGTVKKRVRLAMQKLRQSLASNGFETPKLRMVKDQ